MSRFWAFPLGFCMLLCLHAEAAPPCTPIPGTDQLWSRPGLRFVLVGEIHGTKETPATFGDLVCSASSLKRPIVVGVERPSGEQKALNKLVNAGNEEDSVRGLLSEDGWSTLDGRSSKAMLSLLLTLREWKMQGLVADVVAFDDVRADEPNAMREERMASMLTASANKYPNALVIVLTGNFHASKAKPSEISPGLASYTPMAKLLPQAETVSLYLANDGGEAWVEEEDGCGPHKMGKARGAQRGIVFTEKAPLPGYDGVLATGLPASASPPAIPNAPAPPACLVHE